MTLVLETRTLTGTVFAAADAALRPLPGYRAFRIGSASRSDYCRLIDAHADVLTSAGVPAADLPFMKRFPRSPLNCVERVVADLHRRGLLPTNAYDAAALRRTALALEAFAHGPFKTFIYPEEGLVLGAIADICKPRHAVFLGSYYGYWAHWALPAIVNAGGKATLVDPNDACCDVARKNLQAYGFADRVDVVAARGEHFLAETSARFDFVVLDAENPRDHPEPEQRGKAVYHSLTRACLPRLSPGALLTCHNVLFGDHTGDAAFTAIIGRNRDELGPFAALVTRAFSPFVEYRTTEGVGIGRFRIGHAATSGEEWPIAADVDMDMMS